MGTEPILTIKCTYKYVEDLSLSLFVSELTKAELEELHRRALDQMRKKGNGETKCQLMTRNKKKSYYRDIMSTKQGIMKKYIKDNNGDPASAITEKSRDYFSPLQWINQLVFHPESPTLVQSD